MDKSLIDSKFLIRPSGTTAEDPIQSPFLPGTKVQWAWDSTALGMLKTCPRLYQYIMIEGWESNDESIHLRFGIEYHQALQDFDMYLAEGLSREDSLRKIIHEMLIRVKDWDPDPDTRAGKYKNPRSLVSLVVAYVDHYHPDPAKTYILSNGKPAVELSFRFELDFGPKYGEEYEFKCTNGHDRCYLGADSNCPYCEKVSYHPQPYLLSGHLDRVVDWQDSLFVLDHKTSLSTLGDYYFDQYEPHNQMTLYTLASKVILSAPIKGVIIDAAQIMVDSHRFVRGITYRTSDQLAEWTQDLRYWLGMAEHYAENEYWPMNDTACDKFGGCRFRGICSKSPQVREQFLKSKFTKLEPEARWNPLRAR